MIEQAFHTYIKAVETRFEAGRHPPAKKRGLKVLPNKERHLCDLVEQLEEGPEFRALLKETISAFRRKDWHSSRSESSWRDPIRNFFCRTGFYTDTYFRGSDTLRDLFHRYEKAFQCRSVQTTYLAPMEFVKFPKPELKFSRFEIRRFGRKELDKLIGNEVNRVFYPHAFLDKDTLDALQEYWFIVARVKVEPRRFGRLYLSTAVVAAAKGRVYLEYTRFPPAIERALARLVLFDWVGDPHDALTYSGRDGSPFGFNIPFVIRVNDNDLIAPESAPDLSKLTSYGPKYGDPDTGEEYNAHHVIFDLNESRETALEQCVQRADECLRQLEKKECDTIVRYVDTLDTRWPFLKVAIGNLIKAFFTEDDLEQLLWHVTTLEALLSEPKQGVTASVARRIAAILGTSEMERKKVRKQFKDLYDFRSGLVHGRDFEENIHREKLFEARMTAMRATIWFVHYLVKITEKIDEDSLGSKVPTHKDFLTVLDLSNAIWFVRFLGEIANRINRESCKSEVSQREEFLILLDLSNADRDRLKVEVSSHHESLVDLSKIDRTRLKALLNNIPNGFPAAPDWSP